MKFNKCQDCSAEFLFKRAKCPECSSSSLQQIEVVEGKALETVHLIATPNPFPDDYSVVMFETSGGARGFCRTTQDIKKGNKVSITEDEFGPVCSQN